MTPKQHELLTKVIEDLEQLIEDVREEVMTEQADPKLDDQLEYLEAALENLQDDTLSDASASE